MIRRIMSPAQRQRQANAKAPAKPAHDVDSSDDEPRPKGEGQGQGKTPAGLGDSVDEHARKLAQLKDAHGKHAKNRASLHSEVSMSVPIKSEKHLEEYRL